MEKQYEMNDDTVPHAILAHQKQLAVEKATSRLLEAEIQDSLCDRINDRFQDIEPGQNYPVNTFR